MKKLIDLNSYAVEVAPGKTEKPDWLHFVVDSSKQIEKPKPILIQTSTGITLFNYRNTSTGMAAMKVGKTKLNMAFVVAILHPDGYLDLHCPKEDTRILFVDTEQDTSDTLEFVNGVNKLLDFPEDKILENFKAINLREALKQDRKFFIETAISEFKPDFVIIDGSVDLCNDFNNISDSSETVEMLTRWSTKYNCHIHTNIHVNKGVNNNEARGHLGQILRQKGEVTLQLTKKIDLLNYVQVSPTDSRHRPIEMFNFRINEFGLPETFNPPPKKAKDDLFREQIEKCFEKDQFLRHTDLANKLMEIAKIKIGQAKTRIKNADGYGWIRQNKSKMYLLNNDLDMEAVPLVFDGM